MGTIFTRFGDGTATTLSEKELRADLEAGTADAGDRGKIPPLSDDDLRHLFDIFKAPQSFLSVEPGNEVVLTYDAGTLKIRRVGVAVDRIQALQIYEKIMGADTMELCHVDYSFKPLKPILTMEQPVLEQALLATHIPLFYGAMPNLGLYSQPDGPFPNPAELMPAGKIKEAQESYEQTVAEAVRDIVFVAAVMHSRPATRTSASSSAWPASSCWACTAACSTTGCGWPGSTPTTRPSSPPRPASPSSAPWSTPTPAGPRRGTWRAP
jgi:dimethylamine--corrinoid protein Co-methyltransferase